MASSTVEYRDGLDYGVGVDTPSGEARNVAVVGAPSSIQNTPGGTISFSLTQVSTMEDLTTSLGISASASGSYGLFSASARFNYAKDCNVNTQSVFLCVSVEVTQAFEEIVAPGISVPAATLLANGNTTAFQNQFGDMFVRGLLRGGRFFGVIEIFTKTETDKETIAADVQGSYATASAEVSFNQSFQQTTSNHFSKVTCYIEGGDPNLPLPVTVNDMITRAQNFPKENVKWPVPYTALLDSYSILPLPNPPTYIDLQHQKDVLAQCATLRDQDLGFINDINYIEGHLDQFIDAANVAKYPLGQWKNDLSSDLDTIATAASFAINNPKQAALPQLKMSGAITLPQRLSGKLVTVPDLTGFPRDVQDKLDALGLIGSWSTVTSTNPHIDGEVFQQNPAAGTVVPFGSTVNLVIADSRAVDQ